MLNPVLSNFKVQFGEYLFPQEIVDKYDRFLLAKNYPLKKMRNYFHETIQIVQIPGQALQTLLIAGLPNMGNSAPSKTLPNNPYERVRNWSRPNEFPHPTVNRTYPGTSPYNDIIDGVTVNITFKNSILNWLYLFEWMYKYYKRTREAHEFDVNLIMMDSAEIPMINFRLIDCYVSALPGLEFAYNANFSESKTFDMSFVFNRFDVRMIIPDFNSETLHL